MATVNKVTTLSPVGGTPPTTEQIQVHLDEQNSDGWHLVGIDNLMGWYRFFWAKEV